MPRTKRLPTALAELIARAAPMRTRPAPSAVRGAAPNLAAVVEARLRTWQEVAARGQATLFARRLAWDHLDEAAARAHVAPRHPRLRARPPRWARTLARVYGLDHAGVRAAFASLPSGAPLIDPSRPLPFEHLHLPLVLDACRRLSRRHPDGWARLEEAARDDLARALLEQVCRIWARALYVGFSVARSLRPTPALWLGAAPGTSAYDAYIRSLEAGGLWDAFREYPVAARLATTAADLWVDAVGELLERLLADSPALAAAFGPAAAGRVVAVQTAISDTHERGRAVAILTFDGGLRVVYKPRSLGMERCFSELLHWVNAHQPRETLRTLHVLPRSGYGWIEFAQHAPCTDAVQIERFYRRCGMLLALTYALNGSDFHLENLIAAGEDPVLLDMEMLLGHRFALVEELPGAEMGAAPEARRWLLESAWKVGILPWLKVGNEGYALDMGALAAARADADVVEVACWRDPNSDAMRVGRRPLALQQRGHNLPALGEQPVDAACHVEAIAAGFRAAYTLLLRHRAELLAPDGLLQRMGREPVRFIFRHTNLYATALERGLHPAFLRDGIERSLQFERLADPLLALERRPDAWPLLAEEHRALERMDVPLFGTRASSRDLPLPSGRVVEHLFQRTALEEATERVRQLGAADLRRQLRVLRGSFAAADARGFAAAPRSPGTAARAAAIVRAPRPRAPSLPSAPDAGNLVDGACAVAESVLRAARRSAPGEITWLAPMYVPRARRWSLGPATCTLADGYGGIALFLAALARVTGEERYRRRALAALRPLTHHLDELERFHRFRHRLDVGAGTGFGSAVYALVRAAGLLQEPQLLGAALRVSALLDPTRCADDDALDAVSGAAGAVIALLVLHEATGDAAALDVARAYGGILLERRQTGAAAEAGWPARGGTMDDGLAHGRAGVLLALARLARSTGEDPWRDLAHTLMADAAALECCRQREACAAWADGTTGLGLARLAASRLLGEGTPAPGLSAAADNARRHLLEGSDDLAAGTLGRADLLLAAGLALGRPALLRQAQQAGHAVLARGDIARTGRTGWTAGFAHPGLFRGRSGIGYGLLRLAAPEAVPDVLTWD